MGSNADPQYGLPTHPAEELPVEADLQSQLDAEGHPSSRNRRSAAAGACAGKREVAAGLRGAGAQRIGYDA
jgi:hypothetical protein